MIIHIRNMYYRVCDNFQRVTTKKDFLKMPLSDRKCEVELYEDCRSRKLLEVCGCVPWELPLTFQVTLQQHYSLYRYIYNVRREKGAAQKAETVSRNDTRRVSTLLTNFSYTLHLLRSVLSQLQISDNRANKHQIQRY